MALYSIGQRVRVVRTHGYGSVCQGREATILAIPGESLDSPERYGICVDGVPPPGDAFMNLWWASGYALEPLLPPAADEWAADKVKSVTKPTYIEPERKVSPMKVTDDIVRRYFR